MPRRSSRSVPLADALWRLVANPAAAVASGLALALWIALAAVVPQQAEPEITRLLGGSAWQLSRLFGVHQVHASWLTWLLASTLGLSLAGLHARGRGEHVRAPLGALAFAIVCALLVGRIESEGRIILREGAGEDISSFSAERITPGRRRPVQLPFALSCDAETPRGLPCRVLRAGSAPEQVFIPPPGRGAASLEDLRITWAASNPTRHVPWVRLGSGPGAPVVSNGETVELAGPDGARATFAAVTGPGTIAVASGPNPAAFGVDGGAAVRSGTAAATISSAPLGIDRVGRPRWIELRFASPWGGFILAALALLALAWAGFAVWRIPASGERP